MPWLPFWGQQPYRLPLEGKGLAAGGLDEVQPSADGVTPQRRGNGPAGPTPHQSPSVTASPQGEAFYVPFHQHHYFQLAAETGDHRSPLRQDERLALSKVAFRCPHAHNDVGANRVRPPSCDQRQIGNECHSKLSKSPNHLKILFSRAMACHQGCNKLNAFPLRGRWPKGPDEV